MLKRLSDVQALDLQIDALEGERGQVPQELTDLVARVADLESRLERKAQEVADLRRRVNASELELKTLSERRKGAADSAMRAASAKEAAQFQNQELQFATRVQELEEDTLPLLEQLERVTGEHDALRAELDGLQPTLAEMRAREDERVAQVDARIAETRAQRDELAAGVDRPLLRQYEQVRAARRGLALVEIVNGQSCGGCSVRLPIHVVQKVRRGEGVTRCPSCGRILWSGER
ncbi:MAG TPA: C4-type zinc ribbon domain-containing protein [Trueperaceae bacterium]|jgi:predicted  nucleic acid-binding Zn-ribbon protein